MGLAEGIVAVVDDVAGDRPVERIGVSVGAAQAVVGDSLELNFRLLTDGTRLQAAALAVTHVAGDGLRVDEIVLAGGEVIQGDFCVVEVGHGSEDAEAAADYHSHPAWR